MVSDANTIIVQTEIQKQLNIAVQTGGGTTGGGTAGGGSDPQPTTLNGYASGISEWKSSQGHNFVVSGTSPNDLGIRTDPSGMIMSAKVIMRDVENYDSATSAYQFDINQSPGEDVGSPNNTDVPATSATATVFDNNGNPYTQTSVVGGYFLDGDQAGLTRLFPKTFGGDAEGPAPKFCSNCNFMRWGEVGAVVQFSNGGGGYTDQIHPGWWVAGDIPTVGQLPTTGTAYYSGHAVGTVRTVGTSGGWLTYVAAGDMKRIGTSSSG